ncbi:integral membrane protein [Colletotrichum tofieldiae]|uniref:Integral membrane protein n=1 Tax=Colletotrichum tofieldiae TaxID=708197 RepID=A0A161VH87_9PEZI|nr:integral membrane protein [Colletotrichum tofieldiae]
MAASNNDPRGRIGFLPPPPGETPNFDNPQDINWTLNVAVLIVCNVLATASFMLRCYVRFFINRRILVADLAHYGLGYHAWEVTVEDYCQLLKWLYASSIVYIPAAYFTKVTLLLLIAHVFAVNERIAKGIHLFIWVLLFMYTPIQTIKITICVPIEDYWLPSVAPRCINQRKIFIVDTSIAVFVDLVILLLPIFMTWSLTMSPRKKLKIMLMLGAGGGATAATLFRLVTAIRFVDSPDLTVSFVSIDLTACIELTIGLVCACLPSVNVLFKRHQSSRERARDFNVPRTGRFGSTPREDFYNWWDTVTRKTRTVDTTNVTAPQPDTLSQASLVAAGRQSRLVPLTTFNHDLALLSGRSVHETSETELKKFDLRVNSSDGRKDGWLSPQTEGDVERAQRNVAGTRIWSTIWDGRSTDIP